jgi:glycosyltransferase involved in cell wall biosynthesis
MTPAWVIVTGDVVWSGGQDRANAALAHYLVKRGGARIHIVAHRVAPDIAASPEVRVHLVPRPAGSHFLGGFLLDQMGRRVARDVIARAGGRVVVNGGNCDWPDVNWVHCLHHAWQPVFSGAPTRARLMIRTALWYDRISERRSLRRARLVIANSERTRADLIRHLDIDPRRIQVVYLGCDANVFGDITPTERAAARRRLGLAESEPVVLFVGALGFEGRKGFDILLESWKELSRDPKWTPTLLAIGPGPLAFWQAKIAASGLAERVRLLGHVSNIAEILAAADLLVGPSRYDSYGLTVHEALCRGIPAIVSRNAGVAERFTAPLSDLVLEKTDGAARLAQLVRTWRDRAAEFKGGAIALGRQLRQDDWDRVAARIVSVVEEAPPLERA